MKELPGIAGKTLLGKETNEDIRYRCGVEDNNDSVLRRENEMNTLVGSFV